MAEAATLVRKPGCVFHDRRWSGSYQHVCNKIRETKIFPSVAYFAYLKKAACSCHEDVMEVTLDDDRFVELNQYYRSEMGNDSQEAKAIKAAARPFLLNLSPADNVRIAFLNLLKEISEKKLETLMSFRRQKKVTSPAGMCEETFDINIPQDYVGLVIGEDGKNLKRICRHRKCRITIGDGNVVILAEDEKMLKELKDSVTRLVAEVIEARRDHEECVMEYERQQQEEERSLMGQRVEQPSEDAGVQHQGTESMEQDLASDEEYFSADDDN